MVANAFLKCRVSSQMKERLRRTAEGQGLTETAFMKQVLMAVLPADATGDEPVALSRARTPRDNRIYVRLGATDALLLGERSAARGMAPATYLAVLARAHLRQATPLPKEELLALRRAVAELGAIGRNLNQIARATHLGGHTGSSGGGEFRAMLKVAEALRDHVKALLKANEASWREDA